jgi:hypothetical protein
VSAASPSSGRLVSAPVVRRPAAAEYKHPVRDLPVRIRARKRTHFWKPQNLFTHIDVEQSTRTPTRTHRNRPHSTPLSLPVLTKLSSSVSASETRVRDSFCSREGLKIRFTWSWGPHASGFPTARALAADLRLLPSPHYIRPHTMPYSHWLCIPESLSPTPTPTRLVSYMYMHKSVHPELHSTIIARSPAAHAQAQEAESTRSCPKLRSTRDRPTAGRPVLEDAQTRRTHRMGGSEAHIGPPPTGVSRAHSILVLGVRGPPTTDSPSPAWAPASRRPLHPLRPSLRSVNLSLNLYVFYAHTYPLHRRTLPQCMYNNQSIAKILFSVLYVYVCHRLQCSSVLHG